MEKYIIIIEVSGLEVETPYFYEDVVQAETPKEAWAKAENWYALNNDAHNVNYKPFTILPLEDWIKGRTRDY